MPLTVTPLTPVFCAEIAGVDIRKPLDDATFAKIRAAFDDHSILVFPGQPMNDEQQIAFSERFGRIERSYGVNPGAGFVRIALVAGTAECVEAAERVAAFCQTLQ